MNNPEYDVLVVGAGQAGLALGYYLRKTNLKYALLDAQSTPGGAWNHTWPSLRLFSPAQFSSLPGVFMPGGPDYYPTRDETIAYLSSYEERYHLPILRPISVDKVIPKNAGYILKTDQNQEYTTKAVLLATGTWTNPIIPNIPGASSFQGTIVHSSQYQGPEPFRGLRIAVVGEGNSGAQILADLQGTAQATHWITKKPPEFLPDDVDGRYLFDQATQQYYAKKKGKPLQKALLGQIVMVPSVKEARAQGIYRRWYPSIESFSSNTLHLADNTTLDVDVVIYCTGFRPALQPLREMGLINDHGKVETQHTQSEVPGLWVVGYGNWTGFASATLIGVGRSARQTVKEVEAYVQGTTH